MSKELPYSSKFSIYSYDDIASSDWNDFVLGNNMGYAFHLHEMVGIGQNDFDADFDVNNISFAIFDKLTEKIILLMPLYVKAYSKLEGAIEGFEMSSQRGIVIKDNLPCKYEHKLSAFFIAYMDILLSKYGIKKIYTEMPALTKYNLPHNPNIVNPLIHFGFTPNVRYTWVVNLSKEDDRLLLDCEETTRQSIKKFLLDDRFIFTESNNITRKNDYIDFVQLLEETYQRSFTKVKNKGYYCGIFSELSPEIFRVFFIREKLNNKPIATAVILVYNNTAKYYLGASIGEKPIGINKYLVYKIMQELKLSGIKYFETGGAYPFLRKTSKRKGISDFKKSFGTFLHNIYIGNFYSNNSIFWKNSIKAAKKEFKEKGTITLLD